MERRFPIINGAQTIKCGHQGCTATAQAGRNGGKGGGALPPDAIAKFFSGRGWLVGRNPRKDRCPDHAKPQRQPKEEPPQMAADPKVVILAAPDPGASDKPPREMGRDDRRLIFAKLEEVYIDEKTGYSTGWNDEAVAKDMAVPRAWVALIREENFGPQKAEQSAEIIAINERIATLETEANDLGVRAGNIAKAAGDALDKATEIFGASAQLVKQAEALRAEVKRMTGAR